MAEDRVQRRLAAILAADVVGYSRLMETDEAGTLGALKAWQRDTLHPLVASHGGRVVKLMGDVVVDGSRRPCMKTSRRSLSPEC